MTETTALSEGDVAETTVLSDGDLTETTGLSEGDMTETTVLSEGDMTETTGLSEGDMTETTILSEEVKPEEKYYSCRYRYKCPWTDWVYPNGVNFALKNFVPDDRWTDQSNIPHGEELDRKLPVQDPDLNQLETPPPSGAVQATWIGHATVLVQLDGITILTDPVFSDCTGPPLIGYRRYRPAACTVEKLPAIDAVIISHNHFDHLDADSVQNLDAKFGSKLVWYVPKGMKSWMETMRCRNVVELSWWEEHKHCNNLGKDVTFVLTPAQHWSGRSLWDTNKSLWGSWVVKGPRRSFFFAGDTGYCDVFKQIGNKYGPFDLSAIPIGAYYPSHFMSPQHIDPQQAVRIHQDVKSRNSLGIHWGTFKLTKEFYLEPREKLKKEVEKAGLSKDSFVTIQHGETKTFGE